MTRLLITAAGHRFVAETHPDAPLTVAAFLTLLPYRQKLIHVRWSGEGCWVPLGEWKLETNGIPVGFENHTSHPSVGDILFYPGGYSETEIILAYGACSFASKMGQLAGNHFLTIVEGKENLRALGTTVLWKGAQDVVFELME
ncbi:MAG: cyclophilin-like superfamily protein [Rhizobacter sp.]|nr:cyclophilin-like superfamily protein [Rhizobacter sp.]